MLFTVNKSPLTSDSLTSLFRIAPAGTPILLLEDGVFGAKIDTKFAAEITKALTDHPIYALTPDLEARGIQKVIPGIQLVDYDGFVGLVEKEKVIPWL